MLHVKHYTLVKFNLEVVTTAIDYVATRLKNICILLDGTGSGGMALNTKCLEWFGVVTAIVYSLLVAFNIGAEFVGFSLLLMSAIAIGVWAYLGRHRGILFLQFFYALAGIIGMLRWF